MHSLTEQISRDVSKSSRLYYASAADIAADLPGALKQLGYEVERAVFYKTLNNPALLDKSADYILLYSQKGARALVQSGFKITGSTLISVSNSVDAALGRITAKSRKIAERPNHNSMLKHLDRP